MANRRKRRKKKAKWSFVRERRILFTFGVLAILMFALLFRTAWIQVVNGDEYKERAMELQTSDIPIAAKRGSIYDRNGEVLASSVTCYTVWVRPSTIRETYSEKGQKIAEAANSLAVVLGMDSSIVTETLNSDEPLLRLKSYIEKDVADQVRELEIPGIEIAEDTKRFYPLGSFAANLLGSVNGDGIGRSGIELAYNEYLSGVAGRSVRNTDINGNLLWFGKNTTYEALDGLGVVLTIDEVLQHYLEEAVNNGLSETQSDRVYAIAMDPNTAEVLAMAVAPSFDPNDPTNPIDPAVKEVYDTMTDEEQVAYLSKLWRNPLINDTYEPGSTLKLITASATLEEGLANPNTEYYCSGAYQVEDALIHDAEYVAHGVVSLTKAVGMSCNSAHMQMALNLGLDRYYKYLELFGLMEPTGIDYPAETWPIIYDKDDIASVELATMGFGQGIAISPIQLITAVSCIGNGGNLMKPHMVKGLIDEDGEMVVTYEPEEVRKAISEDTAAEMRDIMEAQIELYGGSLAKIPGYRIGGKSGTANKVSSGGYIESTDASFIGMAPMEDPQIVVLVICDSPKTSIFGGSTSARIVRSFLEKALPYMGFEPHYSEGDTSGGVYAYVPDVTGYSFTDAAYILSEYGLSYEIRPELDEGQDPAKVNFTVVDQYPKAGQRIAKDEKVFLYRE